MPTVVVAMDKFKGSASAQDVCAAVCAGIHQSAPDVRCVSVPLADGGDGTVAALCRAGWEPWRVSSVDAQGAPVTADVARRGETAVIELASICGIARWRGPLDPWNAHTMGVGMAIRECTDSGVRDLVLAVGGSASTDGGLGALLGLGFMVTDSHGARVPPGLIGLVSAAVVEPPADFPTLQECTWTVLVDVTAPLCGPDGAARRFGPNKGLTDADVQRADALLSHWDSILAPGALVGDLPGTGAAGGIAAPFVALLDARIESGFDFVAEQCGLQRHIDAADLVVTGEGRVDESSSSGKVVGKVLVAASRAGVPVAVVAGDVDGQVRHQLPRDVVTLVDLAGDAQMSMTRPTHYLEQAGRLLGESWPT